MNTLVIVSVVLGCALAAPQLPRESPEVVAARDNFIREYNRLAALAAAAEDIDLDGQATRNQFIPAVRPQQAPVVVRQPSPQLPQTSSPLTRPLGFPFFSFTTNLGDNQIFDPRVQQVPAVAPVQQPAPVFTPNVISPATAKWVGPMADTVPAGVNGLPRQVEPTAEVAAAAAAHFAAHRLALQNAPVRRQ